MNGGFRFGSECDAVLLDVAVMIADFLLSDGMVKLKVFNLVDWNELLNSGMSHTCYISNVKRRKGQWILKG